MVLRWLKTERQKIKVAAENREFNRERELGDWERFSERNQERSKLAAACIELVISWSMWWWGAALSRGCRHIAEPRKSLGLALLCLVFCFFFWSCAGLRVAEFIQRQMLTNIFVLGFSAFHEYAINTDIWCIEKNNVESINRFVFVCCVGVDNVVNANTPDCKDPIY